MTAITIASASVTTAPSPAGVYRRRRVVASVLLAGLLYGMFLIAAAVIGEFAPVEAEASPPAVSPTVHIVQPGDTLWAVAASIDSDGDLRDTVDRLVELNGDAALDVGTRLVLPATGS